MEYDTKENTRYDCRCISPKDYPCGKCFKCVEREEDVDGESLL